MQNWKPIWLDKRAIKFTSAKLFLRDIENTISLVDWINTGITNGAIEIFGNLNADLPISFDSTTGTISISQSDTDTDGYLSSTDWNTFNDKIGAANNGLTLSGTTVKLGGALLQATELTGVFDFSFRPSGSLCFYANGTNLYFGVGVSPSYKFDTLLGTSEQARIRSTTLDFRIQNGTYTSGFYNLNTGASGNASQVFTIGNLNTVNDVLNRSELYVNANGNSGLMMRSYSTAAAHGADAGRNWYSVASSSADVWLGPTGSNRYSYLGGLTGSGQFVSFSTAVSSFVIPLGVTTTFSGLASINNTMTFISDAAAWAAAASVTTATAGSQTLPANPDGFLKVLVNGVSKRIPYYNA